MSEQPAVAFAEIFPRLLEDAPLSAQDVRAAFDAILAGRWTPVQVGAFAALLRKRGETTETLVAAAQAMRDAMTAVACEGYPVLDTCGTGGDGAHTLNLSTAAAVVVAASGVHVAKHGNRSVSSRCGSADVVEALGIPIDVPPERQAEVLRQARIAFLFAPAHHPALRHAAQARRELGVRTIFNALGPLANPARATHQLVGVYEDALRPKLAAALATLGATRAWVVRSEDGLDEVSPSAPTRVSEVVSGEVREHTIAPETFGLPRASASSIRGGDSAENASAIESILRGEAHAARDAVLLNAAAALCVATGDEPRACAERARQALERGEAAGTLDAWRKAAGRAKP